MPTPVPFSLPQELVTAARTQRSSQAMATITSDLDSTISQGMSALKSVAGQAVAPLTGFAKAMSEGGISVPSVEDLTPAWIKETQQRATQAVQGITSGQFGVQVPSLQDLTPASMRPQTRPTTGTALTGPPAAVSGPSMTGATAAAGPITIDRSSPTAFLGSFRPAAEAALAQKGYPTSLAPILAAIPMNEQGWQKDAPGSNYYGIKGSNPRTGANTGAVSTWEDYGAGRVNIQDTFRAYADPSESVADFLDFLETNPRYGQAVKIGRETGDPAQFIRAVHAAGYATDPQWSQKILQIAARVPAGAPAAPQRPLAAPGGPSGAPAASGAVRVVPGALPHSYWTSGGTHGGAPAADIFAPLGAPIVAPVSGVSRPAVYPSGGNATIIAGDDGRHYYLAHGHVPFVGGRVEAGQPIGQVGQSGNARGTSPHLHYAIATNPGVFDARNGSGDITGEAYWTTPDGRPHSVSDGHDHGPAAPPGGPPAANSRPAPPRASAAPAAPRPTPGEPGGPPLAPGPVWMPPEPQQAAPFQDTFEPAEAPVALHPRVSTAFEQANGRPPTPEEQRELASLGFA